MLKSLLNQSQGPEQSTTVAAQNRAERIRNLPKLILRDPAMGTAPQRVSFSGVKVENVGEPENEGQNDESDINLIQSSKSSKPTDTDTPFSKTLTPQRSPSRIPTELKRKGRMVTEAEN